MITQKQLGAFLFESEMTGLYRNFSTPYTPWIDVCVILFMVQRYQPKTFLEIGTHWGATTRILAERFPEMSIVTVDPGDQVPSTDQPSYQHGEFLPQDEIGKLVEMLPNVTIIKQPFRDISWKDQCFEMIFIDGNHSLPHVVADSELSRQLVTSPGVILWHDHWNVPDVGQALKQLDWDEPIVTLEGTWMALCDTHPGSSWEKLVSS